MTMVVRMATAIGQVRQQVAILFRLVLELWNDWHECF